MYLFDAYDRTLTSLRIGNGKFTRQAQYFRCNIPELKFIPGKTVRK